MNAGIIFTCNFDRSGPRGESQKRRPRYNDVLETSLLGLPVSQERKSSRRELPGTQDIVPSVMPLLGERSPR